MLCIPQEFHVCLSFANDLTMLFTEVCFASAYTIADDENLEENSIFKIEINPNCFWKRVVVSIMHIICEL